MFWMFYILDKGLSLRLGRCSNIQDSDTDVPAAFDKRECNTYQQYTTLALSHARLQGETYQQLYSAHALSLGPGIRKERAQRLCGEVSQLRFDMQAVRVSVAARTF